MSEEIFDIDAISLLIAEQVREKSTKQGRIPFLTGDLRKSIQAELISPGKSSVGSTLPYARAVHDGATIKPKKTAPYKKEVTRRSKSGKVSTFKQTFHPRLVFEIDGETIFAKQVTIPSQPFLHEAFEEMDRENYDFLNSYLEKQGIDYLEDQFKDGIVFDISL